MSAAVRPRKAIFPVAGFGVRFLPATKACPKELLPIIDRPLIQYAVEEAAAAGIRDMVFITGRNKRAIEDHFDKAYELERELAVRDNEDALQTLRDVVPSGVRFSYVRQPAVAGVGDALLRARRIAGDEPFAVLLPDDLIDSERPALAELLERFEQERSSVVAVAPMVEGDAREAVVVDETDGSIRRLVPAGRAAGAALGLVGRAIFTPGLWTALASLQASGTEASYAAGIGALLQREPVMAYELNGRRYDCGTKVGYLEAQLAYARKRPELWQELRHSLETMIEPVVPGTRTSSAARMAAGH